MTKTGKTILMAVVALIFLVGMTVVGFGVWFFTSALETVAVDEAGATQSFDDVRGRFAGRESVLRMTERGPVIARQPPSAGTRSDLQRVRLMAWDADDRRLASVNLPFWLVRLQPGPLNVSGTSAVPNVRLSITVDDLERYGPAVLIDHTEEDGSRILIWTE
jgi:hypothetical protein